jgi:hypothetical protein
MTKILKNVIVKSLTGKPVTVVDTDEDGEIIWKNEKAGIPVEVDATVGDLLKTITLNIPKELQAQNDSIRAASLWNSADKKPKNKSGGNIEVHDNVYTWYHRVLNRELPLTKEAKDANIKTHTIGIRLWGISSVVVIEQLKDMDSQQTVDQLINGLGDSD